MLHNQRQNQRKRELLLNNISNFYKIFIVRFRAILAILICSLIAVLLNSNNLATFKTKADDLIQQIYSQLSIPVYWLKAQAEHWEAYAGAMQENKFLKEENIKNSHYYHEFLKLQRENQQLHHLLHYEEAMQVDYITTRVVSAAVDELGTILAVNVGSKHSVQKGQGVLSEHGIVGRVVDVSENSARVLLLVNNSSKIPVRLFSSEISCIAIGDYEHNILRILYIEPTHRQIEENDLVFTSGEGNILPYGLYVGKVEKMQGEFVIKPATDLSSIEIVKILLLKSRSPAKPPASPINQ